MAFSSSLFYALVVALAAVHAVPVQLQGGLNLMRHDEYGPLPSDFATKYLEDHAGGVEQHNLDDIGGGHMFRQTRRGFDSSAGAFGEPRRFFPLRRMSSTLNGHPGNLDEIDRSSFDRFAKRNIDEIDRTAFDSFFKRNFDEIDRVGWDSFAKRLADYPTGKNRL